jgi:hypothetical protein
MEKKLKTWPLTKYYVLNAIINYSSGYSMTIYKKFLKSFSVKGLKQEKYPINEINYSMLTFCFT